MKYIFRFIMFLYYVFVLYILIPIVFCVVHILHYAWYFKPYETKLYTEDYHKIPKFDWKTPKNRQSKFYYLNCIDYLFDRNLQKNKNARKRF